MIQEIKIETLCNLYIISIVTDWFYAKKTSPKEAMLTNRSHFYVNQVTTYKLMHLIFTEHLFDGRNQDSIGSFLNVQTFQEF